MILKTPESNQEPILLIYTAEYDGYIEVRARLRDAKPDDYWVLGAYDLCKSGPGKGRLFYRPTRFLINENDPTDRQTADLFALVPDRVDSTYSILKEE